MVSPEPRRVALAAACAFSVVLLLVFGVASDASAHSSGPLPGYAGAPGDLDCTQCHTTFAVDSGVATPSLTAPSVVVPGGVHVINVGVTGAQNPLKNGFQATLRDGAGNFVGSWMTTMNPPLFPTAKTFTHPFNPAYHEHTASGNTLNAWTMNWNAPATLAAGPVTLYACVNEANGDASASGDYIYRVSTKIFQASLTTASTTWPGGGVYAVTLAAPGHVGDAFFIAPSEDPTPFPLGGPLDLQVNPLTGFTAYAYTQPGIFINMTGFLGASSAATAYVYVPPLPGIAGLQLHFAAVTTTTAFVPTEVSHRLTVTLQ